MMYLVEFVLTRTSGLPFDPSKYELENIAEGSYFSIWQMEVASGWIDDIKQSLEESVKENMVVDYHFQEVRTEHE